MKEGGGQATQKTRQVYTRNECLKKLKQKDIGWQLSTSIYGQRHKWSASRRARVRTYLDSPFSVQVAGVPDCASRLDCRPPKACAVRRDEAIFSF